MKERAESGQEIRGRDGVDIVKLFQVCQEIMITIPGDYLTNPQLNHFKIEFSDKMYGPNADSATRRFSSDFRPLKIGEQYVFRIFEAITDEYQLDDALVFLQNALLNGTHGLSLVWPFIKDDFPWGTSLLSFDRKEALYGNRRTPMIKRGLDNHWLWLLGGWLPGVCPDQSIKLLGVYEA